MMNDSGQPPMAATGANSRRSILKSTIVTSALTVLSRIFGLLREQVRGFYLGTGMESDAFGIASTIPNMLRRLFAEGAMTAAFVPVFTGMAISEERKRLSDFFSGFMSLFILLMLFVTALGVLFSAPLIGSVFAGRFDEVPGKVGLTIGLTQVMFPYLFLVSVAAILQATLNSLRIFGPSAFTPVLLSITNIGFVIGFVNWFDNAAWALAVGFLLGGTFQMAFQIPFLRKRGIRFRFTLSGLHDPAVWQVARIFLPGIFSAGIYQINVTIAQVIATSLDPGSVASLQYSLRMQELVLGVFAVSIATVILPAMSEHVHKKDFLALKDTLRFSVGLLAFVTIPASIGLMLLATPIVRMLFEYGRFDAHSTEMTVIALYFHAAGVFFIALNRNVVQVFYAMGNLKTPTWIAAIVMVVHIGLCYWLVGPFAHGGIAAAGSISAALNVAILYAALKRRIGRLGTRQVMGSLLRTLGATTAMSGVLVAAATSGFLEDCRGLDLALRLIPTILVAGCIFMLAAHLLRAQELTEFLHILRRRVAKR